MRYDIDIYADNLMLTEEELASKGIAPQTIHRILRLRDVYNYMLRYPLKLDKEYIYYIQGNHFSPTGEKISKRTAYEDIEILHAIVGNFQECSKEWHRWRFNSMIFQGLKIAEKNEDANAIARLAKEYGKYNKLDKEDGQDIGLLQIPHIRFTLDVAVMGFKPIPNVSKVIDQLIAKYSRTVVDDYAADAEIIEISEAAKELPATKYLDNGDAGAIS